MRRPVPMDRIAGLLQSDQGLAQDEVRARRSRYGPNDIVETPPTGWRDVWRETVKDPMLWFLGATSVVFAIVGDYGEALIMSAAIVPLVGMDAFLHRRTQASTQGLRSRLAEHALVIREHGPAEIRAAELVPGDLVVVPSGQWFPADGLIVGGESLQTDESALTGEAYPVRKESLQRALVLADGAAVDSRFWGFAGTRLLTGEARLRIVSTGAETLYGEIVQSAVQGTHDRTPLQQSIATLVISLIVAAAALCLTLAWVRLRQGFGLLDALVSAVTLGVAAIPEEFPIVFSFFLGVGIFRLARRQALVRRAVVVENIGRISCICCDKTGTLTEGRIRVAHRLPARAADAKLTLIASLASRRDSGDPLDVAILADESVHISDYERVATYPFTEDRRRETSVYRTRTGSLMVAAKGAPETILPLCTLRPSEREDWEARIRELTGTAHKVIACAWQTVDRDEKPDAEPDQGYEFAGLLACEDPVRDGVADAVHEATRAGIHVIMITGDHPSTAVAVAREVGIGGTQPRVISGDDLAAALSRDGRSRLPPVDVIARAVPAQKLALVRALQAQGHIVAVTGDGVNDVPALQAADIGIAMGERGTRSAREVAAIVLLDDNFRTIVSAIGEGQQLFRNLRMSFAYLLMIHIPLVFTATLVPLGGYPLLYLPIHIVWLELIIHPTALLVFQALPGNTGLSPIRATAPGGRFFAPWEWLVIGTVGVTITLIVLWSYDRSLGAMHDVAHARSMALVMLVAASAAVTVSLSGLGNLTARITVFAAIASALVLVQTPAPARWLHLEPLHLDDWIIASIGGMLPGVLAALLRYRASLFRGTRPHASDRPAKVVGH